MHLRFVALLLVALLVPPSPVNAQDGARIATAPAAASPEEDGT